MNKKGLLLFFILSIMIVAGCGYKDIDKRFFVVTIGIDPPEDDEKKYKLVLKLAEPQTQAQGGASDFIIVTEECDTVAEGVRMVKSRVERELDFGHTKAIVLGDGVLNRNIREEIDWLLRRRDIQKIAWMSVGKPSAEEVLKVKPKSETVPSNIIFLSFGKTGTETSYTISKYLFEFYRELRNEGIDAVLPVFQAEKDLLAINTAVVFNSRKKVLELTPEETRDFNAIKSEFDKADLKVDQDGYHFIVGAEKYKARYSVESPPKGRTYVKFTLDIKGIIEESRKDISPKKLKEYEGVLERTTKERVEKLLVKLRDADVDPIGFGMEYRGNQYRNPKDEMKDWKKIYRDVEFKVVVKANIKGTGVLE